MDYEVVIGLEVHAQLKTASRIFCGCSTTYGAEPNTQACPICLGLPGILPVLNEAPRSKLRGIKAELRRSQPAFALKSFGAVRHAIHPCSKLQGILAKANKKAVEYALMMALAIHCHISPESRFARKNYFYPDLPKGYQISQYEFPLAEHGWIEVQTDRGTKRIGLRRIHIEEDAGKSIHNDAEGLSYVDFNRCGVPLIEIVSEPDIASTEDAVFYLKRLRSILRYLGISDGKMEEGSFR